MSVTSISVRAFGARGRGVKASTTGQDASPAVSYSITYRAVCDSALDTPPVVYQYLEQNKGTAPWFDNKLQVGNGSDPDAVVRTIDVETVENSTGLFDIVVGFDPLNIDQENQPLNPGTDGELTPNPLDWYDEIDVSYTQTAMPCEEGIFRGFNQGGFGVVNGYMAIGSTLPITNSARVAYDPPIEEERDIRVIRISRNVVEYDGPFFKGYQGRVNADQVVIDKPFYRFRDVLDPFTAKIKYIGATFGVTSGIKYYRQTIEIHVDEIFGWRRKILDRGMVRKREAGDPPGDGGADLSATDEQDEGKANVELNTDASSNPIPEPVLFNGRGQPLANASSKAVYGIWSTKPEVPFAPLAGVAW